MQDHTKMLSGSYSVSSKDNVKPTSNLYKQGLFRSKGVCMSVCDILKVNKHIIETLFELIRQGKNASSNYQKQTGEMRCSRLTLYTSHVNDSHNC